VVATQCACGFTELSDETLFDHLALAFTPDDAAGNDGREHEELRGRACACGLPGGTREELERHLMAAFTPADRIGLDGREHGVRDAS
jgi:hypothetical protein